MNPEKLNEIVKGVVRNVINVGIPSEGGDYENLYDELIAAQVTELLLRPKPYSKESFDNSNDLLWKEYFLNFYLFVFYSYDMNKLLVKNAI